MKPFLKVQKELEKKIKTCNKLKGDRSDKAKKARELRKKMEKTFRTKILGLERKIEI